MSSTCSRDLDVICLGRFLGVFTIEGDYGNRNENGVKCGKFTGFHEISGDCWAGREAVGVLLERVTRVKQLKPTGK